jgi:hypothetical protein
MFFAYLTPKTASFRKLFSRAKNRANEFGFSRCGVVALSIEHLTDSPNTV